MPHPLESLLSYARRLAGDNQQLTSVIVKTRMAPQLVLATLNRDTFRLVEAPDHCC